MNLNTDHLKRCIETLQSSVTLYGQAEAGSVEQEVFRNAIVKGYELVQETSFKLIRKALRDFGHGARQLDATTVKDLLRLAAAPGLLTLDAVERWFVYRDNRNNTAHDYGEGFAKETLGLLPGFLADVTILEKKLSTHFSGGQRDV